MKIEHDYKISKTSKTILTHALVPCKTDAALRFTRVQAMFVQHACDKASYVAPWLTFATFRGDEEIFVLLPFDKSCDVRVVKLYLGRLYSYAPLSFLANSWSVLYDGGCY